MSQIFDQLFHIESYNFSYPDDLVATVPQNPTRLMVVKETPESDWQVQEADFSQISDFFTPGDVLVINETQVQKRRVFSDTGLEVLFLDNIEEDIWSVLFPAKKYKIGNLLTLPGGVNLQLLEKGLPQKVKVIAGKVNADYFANFGEMALPPYIQKARGNKQNQEDDETWYQTQWAKNEGSAAAPTASLHFSNSDLKKLEDKGVKVLKLTLHVGLGTFLPMKSENIKDHNMHSEYVSIPKETLNLILEAKKNNYHVWALGSTVIRALESYAEGILNEDHEGASGHTQIFIYPGFQFKWVSGLLTNFHQPQSTLMAMVAAFSSLTDVQKAYAWAMDRKFKLFSYGDLSLWKKNI
jgi:S-adenosylmethionine:tRNA ribosyltransferase-isomerase